MKLEIFESYTSATKHAKKLNWIKSDIQTLKVYKIINKETLHLHILQNKITKGKIYFLPFFK